MAVEPGDVNFKSQLDEASKKKAKDELHELNDKDREMAVQSFRQWVLQQDWLKTPTDFGFLLRFLRCRKFSQLEARETLENYWTIKTKTPEWFRDIDPKDKTIQEILRTGFYCVPKVLTKDGMKVIIEQQGLLDIDKVKKKWGVDNVYKAIVLICDWLNRDENVQVNGLKVFIDNSGIKMAHFLTLWDQEHGKKIMKFYQKSLPARMKGLHMYKEPAFFDAAFKLFGPLMSKKTKERMHLHGSNMVKVYEHIDMSTLTEDYLPDDYEGPSAGTRKELVEDMIADMCKPEFRDYIRDLSSKRYGVDLKKRAQDDAPVASFRKLNVD